MTGRSLRDRTLVLVLGLALLAAGLALVGWQAGLVLDPDRTVRTGRALELADRSWWPWAQGGAGGAVALLGLAWLGSHRPRRGARTAPVGAADPVGTIEVDLSSLGTALCAQLEASGTTVDPRADFHRDRGHLVCVVRSRLSEDADLVSTVGAADDAARDLARAVPDEVLHLQLRWRAPRAPRARRAGRTRRTSVRLE